MTVTATTTSQVDRVLLAAPRGFCAGVEMAIKALSWMVRTFPAPVYCFHEIVHNKSVVDRFIAQGVIFVDDIDAIPAGSPIMLSAHGSAPEVVANAISRGGYVVDSVCPLVTKVHHELRVRSNKGYKIIYIGHEGHEEAVGTMAVAPHATTRVEKIEDVAALPDTNEPLALLAQTTLSHRDWQEVAQAVKVRVPQVWQPGKSDLCFAIHRLGKFFECKSIGRIGRADDNDGIAFFCDVHQSCLTVGGRKTQITLARLPHLWETNFDCLRHLLPIAMRKCCLCQ